MDDDITDKIRIKYKNQADGFFEVIGIADKPAKAWGKLAKLVTETNAIATRAILEAMVPAYVSLIANAESVPNIKISVPALRIRQVLTEACHGDLMEYAKKNEFSAMHDRARRLELSKPIPVESSETNAPLASPKGETAPKPTAKVLPFKPK